MALEKTALKESASANTLFNNNKRICPQYDINATFTTDALESELAVCYPVAFNTAVSKHAPWMAPDPTKIVVTLTEAASGTWTLTVNGITTGNIVYNPTAAAVAAALRAIGFIATVAKNAAVYTITFDDDKEITTLPTVTGTVTSISGGSPTAVADAGTATNGTHKIVGFVNPNPILLDDTNDVIGVIMTVGEVHYDEVAALVAVGDVTALEAALKDGLVERGLIVQGLAGIH
jgi:hypothetical protein